MEKKKEKKDPVLAIVPKYARGNAHEALEGVNVNDLLKRKHTHTHTHRLFFVCHTSSPFYQTNRYSEKHF